MQISKFIYLKQIILVSFSIYTFNFSTNVYSIGADIPTMAGYIGKYEGGKLKFLSSAESLADTSIEKMRLAGESEFSIEENMSATDAERFLLIEGIKGGGVGVISPFGSTERTTSTLKNTFQNNQLSYSFAVKVEVSNVYSTELKEKDKQGKLVRLSTGRFPEVDKLLSDDTDKDDPRFKTVQDLERFRNRFGDGVVTETMHGAKLLLNVKFTIANSANKENDTRVTKEKVKAFWFTVKNKTTTTVAKDVANFMQNATIKIDGMQIGGNVNELLKKIPLNGTTCSLDFKNTTEEKTGCLDKVKEALNYTEKFSDQISSALENKNSSVDPLMFLPVTGFKFLKYAEFTALYTYCPPSVMTCKPKFMSDNIFNPEETLEKKVKSVK